MVRNLIRVAMDAFRARRKHNPCSCLSCESRLECWHGCSEARQQATRCGPACADYWCGMTNAGPGDITHCGEFAPVQGAIVPGDNGLTMDNLRRGLRSMIDMHRYGNEPIFLPPPTHWILPPTEPSCLYGCTQPDESPAQRMIDKLFSHTDGD